MAGSTVLSENSLPKVLFLCTHNACRSQMAEGITRDLLKDKVDVYSAGTSPGSHINQGAIDVLHEINIDISHHIPKSVEELKDINFDLVVTVCSGESCPIFHNAKKVIRVPFEDPSHPPDDIAVQYQDKMEFYRIVRDQIYNFIKNDLLNHLFPSSDVIEDVEEENDLPSIPIEMSSFSNTEVLLNNDSSPKIGFFEKYLSVWVVLCMVIGAVIGYFVPQIADALARAQFAQISIPTAILLWLMIFPMLAKIDIASVKRVRHNPSPIILTSIINFFVKPFTMYLLSLLFFRVVYKNTISLAEGNEYIAGCIILAGAPCTAMVFVWSLLMNGDGPYTLVQVAFNDILMIALYVPTVMLLLGVSSIPLPYDTIILAVVLFILVPLIISSAVRSIVIKKYGEVQFNRIVDKFKPVTIVALLAMLVLIFIFQGQKIGSKPLDIVLIAIPLLLQTSFNFVLCYGIGYFICIDYAYLAPASLIATSNFFELAVAVAISVFGLDSGATLATVVGVLIEVPVMLGLVKLCNGVLKFKLDKRRATCTCDFLKCKKG
eukprot:TRINITY_DN739_c0_g1_i2.p1 TRINITY_DN739_c0_g1~~TRINITY_DN739_c0_g1_i2.p1  ORF type:complete len:547 (-),score=67.59 TRINITY_DN739_c0_g1_i2:208-1848(-)